MFGLFHRDPTPEQVARRELEIARHSLLRAQSELEHAIATVDYNTNRIARLEAYVEDLEAKRREEAKLPIPPKPTKGLRTVFSPTLERPVDVPAPQPRQARKTADSAPNLGAQGHGMPIDFVGA